MITVQHMSPFKLSLKEAKLQIINGLIKSSAVTVKWKHNNSLCKLQHFMQTTYMGLLQN